MRTHLQETIRDRGIDRTTMMQSLVESLEIRRLLAAGDVDRSFGDDGLATLAGLEAAYDIAVGPGGKVIGLASGLVVRLNSNGTRDNTFDGDGVLPAPYHFHSAVTVQRDGKILLGGDVNGKFAVARLNLNGTLDTSFGGDGISGVHFIPNGQGRVTDLLVQDDGKIVAVGSAAATPAGLQDPPVFSTVIARYNPDGTLDRTFSDDGAATPGLFGGRRDGARSVALAPDGKIVLSAFSVQHGPQDNFIFRYTSSGRLDQSFSGDGRVDLGGSLDGGVLLAVQSTGKIVYTFADEGNQTSVMDRLNVNGTHDTSFTRQQHLPDSTLTTGLARDIIVLPGDRIGLVGAGKSTQTARATLAAARFLANGQRDTSFSDDGIVFHSFQGCGMSGSGSSLAFDPAGFLLVGGSGATGGICAELPVVLRYHNDDGTLPEFQQPFTGTPYTINQIIEAENFDRGDQGFGYLDQDSPNLGGVYRPDEYVDIHANHDGGNGFNVGWVNTGEYLEYTINVPRAGNYVFDARVATPKNGARLLFSLKGNPLIEVAVPNTGSFANWRTISTGQVNLPAGRHFLRVTFNGPANIGGLTNLNWLRIRPADDRGGAGAAGDLDATFSLDGQVVTSFDSPSPARLVDSVVQPDGRILAVGDVSSDLLTFQGIVARFHPDGTLDQTFGHKGIARFHPGGINHAFSDEIELAPDGKIIIVGQIDPGHPDSSLFVTRLNQDGSPDTTFGGDPENLVSPGSSVLVNHASVGLDAKVQADGKIVLGGTNARDSNKAFIITRLNQNGSVDQTFGRSGTTRVDMETVRTSQDYMLGLEIAPDGKIVAGGVSILSSGQSAFAVARLNSNGSPDTTFFGGRAYIVDPSASFGATPPGGSFELQNDGRAIIVAANTQDPNLKVFRFTDRARPDSTFGNNGLATTNLGVIPGDLEIAPDGRFVIAGSTSLAANGDFRIVRLTSTGQRDATFRQDPSTSAAAGHQRYEGVFIQNDGNIIATGHTNVYSGQVAVIARYLGAGQQQPPPTEQQSPFLGAPFKVNEVIQAEDFDNGGQGIAYHDQEAANLGGVNYRAGLGVDILNTTDDGGGRKVGYLQTNDWLEYTIHVPTAGQYVIQTRIATPKNGGVLTYTLNGNILTGTRLVEIQIPNTGNFNRFQTVSAPAVRLPAGTHVLHVHPDSGDPNGVADINWFRIVPAGN